MRVELQARVRRGFVGAGLPRRAGPTPPLRCPRTTNRGVTPGLRDSAGQTSRLVPQFCFGFCSFVCFFGFFGVFFLKAAPPPARSGITPEMFPRLRFKARPRSGSCAELGAEIRFPLGRFLGALARPARGGVRPGPSGAQGTGCTGFARRFSGPSGTSPPCKGLNAPH